MTTQPLSGAPDRRRGNSGLPVASFDGGMANTAIRTIHESDVNPCILVTAHARLTPALTRTRVATPVYSGLVRVGRLLRPTYTGYLRGRGLFSRR